MSSGTPPLVGSPPSPGPTATSLLVLWPAVAAVAAVLVSAGLADAPRRRELPLRWLLVAQVLVFALLEGFEHAHAGHPLLSVAADPAFRWGIGAQLLSSALLVVAVRLAQATGQRVRARLGRRTAPSRAAGSSSWGNRHRWIPKGAAASSVSERGPPGRLAAA